MHRGGLELTEMTYTRLEDNLLRHRSDRILCSQVETACGLVEVEVIVDHRRSAIDVGQPLTASCCDGPSKAQAAIC